SHRLDDRELADPGGYRRVAKNRHAGYAGRDLLQQFEPFAAQTVVELNKAGGVASRLRQTVDEPGSDRIGDIHEHDRNRLGRVQKPLDGRSTNGQDGVRYERSQLNGALVDSGGVAPAPADVD